MLHPHRVLIPETRIHRRIASLAREVDAWSRGGRMVVVGVLNGSILFLSDLVRHLRSPVALDCIAASSYGKARKSRGKVIFNTGLTLAALTRFLKKLGARRVEACVLLRKEVPHAPGASARFVGFDIPDKFVYGYGLDLAEKFRNLRFIAWVSPRGGAGKARISKIKIREK